MLLASLGCLVYAPARLAPRISPRAAIATIRMQTAEAATDAAPDLATLESWTREYFEAARQARVVEGKSLDAMLADYDWYDEFYVLTGPDVGPLVKADFLAAQRGFTLDFSQAAPDLNYLLDGFHQDPSQPSRVWFTLRYVGTHTGSTRIGSTVLEPKENNAIFGGPELHAIWWTPDKRIKWESVGYVGCKYTGSNQGYGGIGGLLVPLGVPRAFFDVGTPFIKAAFTLSQFAEASENRGRAKSPWTSLPAWWKARKDLGLNVQR